MFRNPFRWLLPAAIGIAVSAALAQQPLPSAALLDPLDSTAKVPSVNHRSALGDYRRFSDEQLLGWREANDAVGRIGGWRAYAREASEPEMPASAAQPASAAPTSLSGASAPTRPMPAGHGGHKKH